MPSKPVGPGGMMPDDSQGASLSDASGPINALEADRYCEELRTFDFGVMGNHAWMKQHEFLQKLNLQAHVNASQQRDEFVLEAMILHEKLPLIIRELIASELWKQNAYPLIKDWLAKNNSIKGYMLLFHEGVLANMLEALLYHKQGCDAAGDAIIELVDYCHRKLMFLLNAPPPAPLAKDHDEFKKQLLAETDEDHSREQEHAINMNCAFASVSITRFLTDHLDTLPLAVTARILDTYDLLMVLCPLLEARPWEHESTDKEGNTVVRRYVQNHWQKVPPGELRKMHKCEIQIWLAIYNLMQDKEIRRRYQFNTFRKNAVLRIRKFLNEGTVDQIPILVDLQRSLDEMTLMQVPPSAEAAPAYLLEQLPEMRQSLSQGVDWKKVVEEQKAGALNDSEEEKRRQAAELSGLFDLDGMDEILSKEVGAPVEEAFHYYTQLTVTGDEGEQIVSFTAESEGTDLSPQAPYRIEGDDKKRLIPARYNSNAVVTASLNGGGGAKPWQVSGRLSLLEGKKKQWLQLGFDPYAMRVQLHVLAEADGSGYHLIHARVTPPPSCQLILRFTPRKQGQHDVLVRARGRGVAAQTPFEVEVVDRAVRVPKLCSASAVLRVGEGESVEEATCEPVDMSLSGASQMVWRQLGKEHTEVRVQLKLAPAAEGGFTITAIRVTPPTTFRSSGAREIATDTESAGTDVATGGRRVVASSDGSEPAAPPAPPPPSQKKKENVPPKPTTPPSEPVAKSTGAAAKAVEASSASSQKKHVRPEWTKIDDDEPRIVEIVPEPAAPTPPPPAPPKAAEPAKAAAPPDGDGEFVEASAFAGAKDGYVFKKGKAGLGYYRDAKEGAKKKVAFAGPDYNAPAPAADKVEVSEPATLEAMEAKKAADALFSSGNVAAAAAAYSELLKEHAPKTILGHAALCNRSACYLAMQHWSECIADCSEGIETAPKDTKTEAKKIKLHLRRAEARLALGLRELAHADVHTADRLVTKDDLASEAQVKAFKARLAEKRSAEMPEDAPSMLTPRAQVAPAAAVQPPATTLATAPSVELTVTGEAPSRTVSVTIVLPGVAKISEVELTISPYEVAVHGAGYALTQALPFKVDDSLASAKFSAKAASLRVKAPEAS